MPESNSESHCPSDDELAEHPPQRTPPEADSLPIKPGDLYTDGNEVTKVTGIDVDGPYHGDEATVHLTTIPVHPAGTWEKAAPMLSHHDDTYAAEELLGYRMLLIRPPTMRSSTVRRPLSTVAPIIQDADLLPLAATAEVDREAVYGLVDVPDRFDLEAETDGKVLSPADF